MDSEDEDLLKINFSEIDEDLASFEKDDLVQQALHRGVDLKKYARELERDLKHAELESVNQYVESKPKSSIPKCSSATTCWLGWKRCFTDFKRILERSRQKSKIYKVREIMWSK